jgi:hypothetical protein
MPKLTSDQIFQLALSYSKFAHELDVHRFNEFDNLTAAQRQTLENNARLIRNFSSSFNGLSLKLALDDLQPTLDHITEASQKMREALKKLSNINKVLNFAATLISLGAAIVTGNIQGIIGGVDELITALP